LVGLARRLGVLAILVASLVAPPAGAQDMSIAKRDVVSGDDFRLRMTAALALGRSHDPSARGPLEHALADGNAAVRTAAAAALSALGDTAAIPALQRQLAAETSPSVKTQLNTTLTALNRIATLQGVQLVVQIGSMKNGTNVRGEALAQVLKNATLNRTRAMNNVVVADPSDTGILARAAAKHVPVLALDGTVMQLTQTQNGTTTQLQANIEFTMRRIPDQTLKGVLMGSATSMGSGPTTTQLRVVTALQDQAIDAAVESALRGADQGMLLAAK
jgi:hypothetical protein